MRHISEPLLAHLKSGATTLSRAWIVVRKDGTTLGFTDHDAPLVVDGVTCEAATGMDATALETTTGLAVDNSQAVGALSAASITEADIEAGRYDGAEVSLYLVNWTNPDQAILQFRGHLGEITRGGGVFEAELRGLSEALNQPIGRAYLRKWAPQPGSTTGGVDLSGAAFTATGTIGEIDSRRVVALDGLSAYADHHFANGLAEIQSGANAGRRLGIRADRIRRDLHLIELFEPAYADFALGDQIKLYQGFDGTAEDYKAKIGDLTDFRGFPHLPGEDWAIAYPQAGEVMDGKSRYQ